MLDIVTEVSLIIASDKACGSNFFTFEEDSLETLKIAGLRQLII